MIVFDEILPKLEELFTPHENVLSTGSRIYVNRDLNGRVRLVVDEELRGQPAISAALEKIVQEMATRLGPHAYPPEQAILWEVDTKSLINDRTTFQLGNSPNVSVIDRLAVEADWSTITPVSQSSPRIVFFSIKGGVGRSTALAVVAWALAEQGKRVLVLDLDLESPGLSSSLLASDRRPTYGIADWLVEDLVDNGDAILDGMVATSDLSHDGDIAVVPAHGRDPGEYVAKLGRVWMPKVDCNGLRERWSQRLGRLLDTLEAAWKPDVVLIDSRSGIDDTASVCLTSLGASLILLFALDGDQTWSGYRMIFQHWLKIGAARAIRDRLQVVGAMIPELGGGNYLAGLRENAWDAFFTDLYDEIPADAEAVPEDAWSFDQADDAGPHAPWPIRWHRGFASLASLHFGLNDLDCAVVEAVFGPLIEGIARAVDTESGTS